MGGNGTSGGQPASLSVRKRNRVLEEVPTVNAIVDSTPGGYDTLVLADHA